MTDLREATDDELLCEFARRDISVIKLGAVDVGKIFRSQINIYLLDVRQASRIHVKELVRVSALAMKDIKPDIKKGQSDD